MNKMDMLTGPARYCMSCGGRLALRKKHGRMRPFCARCGKVYFKNPSSASAVAVLINGKVVLVRRKVAPRAGSWCLPAGFQEYDESPEETAVREAKEETNLDVRILLLHRVYFNNAHSDKNTVVHIYLAQRVGGTMRPGDDASEVRAFPLDRLPEKIAFKTQLEIIESLRREAAANNFVKVKKKPRRKASGAKRKVINVAVLMGGRTAEHDISLATGTMIVNHLDRGSYNIKPVVIDRRGRWHVQRGYIGEGKWSFGRRGTRNDFLPVSEAIARLIEDRVDVVFIAMHGPQGEDGTIQGIFEILGLPYTGSDVCASALAMDKIQTKKIYRYHRIQTPKHLVCEISSWKENEKDLRSLVKKSIGYPCVIKPARLGSSVGSSICKSRSELLKKLAYAFKYDSRILIEELVDGRELTCAVLDSPGGKPPIALPPTEIVPKTRAYFDYHAKYTSGATREITPAPIGKKLTEKVQELAIRAHTALGCYAKSRTDMILRGRTLYVLETNTIPGMTKTSLLPQAAKASGLSFPDLLDRIITLAREAHKRKERHSRTR